VNELTKAYKSLVGKLKVTNQLKISLYRPGQALRLQELEAQGISIQSVH
jgi:hypothetical protein